MNETVKILYSPGYGSGWYTNNTQYPDCLRDSEIIALVEKRDILLEEFDYDERDIERYEYYSGISTDKIPVIYDFLLSDKFLLFREKYNAIIKEIEELANKKWPNGYWSDGAIRDLSIEVMNKGQIFKLKNYDGSESIEYVYTDSNLLVA